MKELNELDFNTSVKYSVEHTWAKAEGDLIVAGISDYAQDQLGEIIFIELPQAGDSFAKDDVFGMVESVKTASDLFIPIGGKIVEINASLLEGPEIINQNPFEKGWMIKIQPENDSELNDLLTAEAYKNSLK